MEKITKKVNEYMKFMQKKLKEKGVKSPFNLKEDERKKFFSELKKEWASRKGK